MKVGGDAGDDENADGAAGEGLDEVAGEDPEGEVVTPSGKNLPSTSSAKKTPKRYQKRQKQDDLEDELLAFIQKESGGSMMSEVEHAFSAHTMRISKHLNPDETEDLLEAVQQLVDSHIRQARVEKIYDSAWFHIRCAHGSVWNHAEPKSARHADAE